MAILNGVEGQARVEVNDKNSSWGGYIIVPPEPLNITYFDIGGPKSKGVYEGPIIIGGKYFFGNGKVTIRKVLFTPAGLRIDFVGTDKFNSIRSLPTIPS